MDAGRALSAAIIRLLRPLVRLLLRNGVPFGAFADLAKQVYVHMAKKEFGLPGRKPTVSRASLITGLSRKEVQRVLSLPVQEDAALVARYNRGARVLSGWVRDAGLPPSPGQQVELPMEGDETSFSALVRKYSGDVPPRAILDELMRVGAVEVQEDGQVRLHARAYVPAGGETEKLTILGTDVAALVATIDHNLTAPRGKARFQRKVAYDNLSEESVAAFRPLASGRGQALLEGLDAWLSHHDRDVNPQAGGTGRMRAGLGVYYFEEDLSEEGSSEESASREDSP